MNDKRKECGCHEDCTQSLDLFAPLDHVCSNPCRWPGCLTPDEHMELLRELQEE
jgi:hypothetical protein